LLLKWQQYERDKSEGGNTYIIHRKKGKLQQIVQEQKGKFSSDSIGGLDLDD
jgi:hypothetical protein